MGRLGYLMAIVTLLTISLGVIVFFSGKNQDTRSKAANDREIMTITPASLKSEHVTQAAIILQNLDPKFQYRLTFDLTYSGETSDGDKPQDRHKEIAVHENKTHIFTFKTPPCSVRPTLEAKLWYKDGKTWKLVDAPTAVGSTAVTIDCATDTTSLPPQDPGAQSIENLPEKSPEEMQVEQTNSPTQAPSPLPTASLTKPPTPSPTVGSSTTPTPTTPSTTSVQPTKSPTPTQSVGQSSSPTGSTLANGFTPTPTLLAQEVAVHGDETPTPTQKQSRGGFGSLVTSTPTPTNQTDSIQQSSTNQTAPTTTQPITPQITDLPGQTGLPVQVGNGQLTTIQPPTPSSIRSDLASERSQVGAAEAGDTDLSLAEIAEKSRTKSTLAGGGSPATTPLNVFFLLGGGVAGASGIGYLLLRFLKPSFPWFGNQPHIPDADAGQTLTSGPHLENPSDTNPPGQMG